jgi:formaldehyde-activating enzyme
MPGGVFRREDREELRSELEKLGKIKRTEIKFKVQDKAVVSNYPAIHTTPTVIKDFTMKVGEGFAGPPIFEVAHIDLLIGANTGPVGTAIERALGGVSINETSSLRIIYERPKTLLVPTVTIRTKRQAENIYVHATAGIQMAIETCIRNGILPEAILGELSMIANVFVHPAAVNRKRIKLNNYKAMTYAIKKALEGRPTIDELLNERHSARHPFKYTP